ncbi:MAG: hypothetical protein VCB59_02995 [Gammaproteobacteria bacterium]
MFIASFVGGSPVPAKIKCWKNNEGVRECGNSVPPEFAQQGHQEMSQGGARKTVAGRAKSLEELEAEQAAEEEKRTLAKEQREQVALDRVLLDTFSSEDDLLLARDGQMAHLESQIKLTDSHIVKLNTNLDELIQDAANHERRGKEPPEKLVTHITSLREQIRDNEQFIATKRVEQDELTKKFEADITQFKKLKDGR